jgi:dihydroxyacetone kinase
MYMHPYQLTDTYGVKVVRLFSGRFMTSLEMSGFSLTVLRLASEAVLGFVDLPARCRIDAGFCIWLIFIDRT